MSSLETEKHFFSLKSAMGKHLPHMVQFEICNVIEAKSKAKSI